MFNTAHFHPMMVHFPIAILTIGFLFDLLALVYKKNVCLSKTGYWLELIGMVGTILAFGTGYFFTSPMEGEAGILRDKHELFATITLVVIILATIYRLVITYLKKESKTTEYLSLGLFFLATLFVSITGYLGGTLVIDFMIGL
jgi:uncharacterized membrane protein